jgi:hypothetical protein
VRLVSTQKGRARDDWLLLRSTAAAAQLPSKMVAGTVRLLPLKSQLMTREYRKVCFLLLILFLYVCLWNHSCGQSSLLGFKETGPGRGAAAAVVREVSMDHLYLSVISERESHGEWHVPRKPLRSPSPTHAAPRC